MTDINNISVIGRLTKDVVVEYTSGGMAIGKGSIAVNRAYKTKDGNWEDTTSFFEFSIFGKTAENLNPYLLKGKRIAISGYLKQDRWQGQDGQNRSKVFIGVEELQLCDGRSQESNNSGYGNDSDYGYGN